MRRRQNGALNCTSTTSCSDSVKQSAVAQDGVDAKVLAEELLAIEHQFRSSVMNPMGGTRMTGDWTVNISGGPGK